MKRLLALLVALAAGVALAGVFLPSSAATVDGSAISRQSLDSDLSAIATSPDYGCFLTEERELTVGRDVPVSGAGTFGTDGGVYDVTFVDDWLGSMVTNRVTAMLAARRGLRVGAADLATARGVLQRRITDVLNEFATETGGSASCGGSGTAVLASMPGWFVAQLTQAEADQALLDARAAGAGLSASAVATYYDAHKATFARECLSFIVVKTQAAADQVAGALAHGSTFAQEAAAASITTGTAANGGAAGCAPVTGTFLAPEVAHLAVGKVTAPFSAEDVYWIASVTSRSTLSLSAARTRVITAILAAGQSRTNGELDSAVRHADVTIDPRYGTPARHKLTLITPPVTPPASTLVSATAITPRASSTAG